MQALLGLVLYTLSFIFWVKKNLKRNTGRKYSFNKWITRRRNLARNISVRYGKMRNQKRKYCAQCLEQLGAAKEGCARQLKKQEETCSLYMCIKRKGNRWLQKTYAKLCQEKTWTTDYFFLFLSLLTFLPSTTPVCVWLGHTDQKSITSLCKWPPSHREWIQLFPNVGRDEDVHCL